MDHLSLVGAPECKVLFGVSGVLEPSIAEPALSNYDVPLADARAIVRSGTE